MNKEIFDITMRHYFRLSNNEYSYILKGEKRTENLERVAQYLFENYWKLKAYKVENIEDAKLKIMDYAWDDNILPYSKFSKNNEQVWGYKYARSTDDKKLGNSTEYKRHRKGEFIEDDTDGAGLHFLLDTKFLFDYMTYGDILVKIKINEELYKDMFVKSKPTAAVNEYSCFRYYVDDILDLRDKKTLDFILKNTTKAGIYFENDVVQHLYTIGVSQEIIQYFKEKLKRLD